MHTRVLTLSAILMTACVFLSVEEANAREAPIVALGAGAGVSLRSLGGRNYKPGLASQVNLDIQDPAAGGMTRFFVSWDKLSPSLSSMPNVASAGATKFREVGLIETIHFSSYYGLYMLFGASWTNAQMSEMTLVSCRTKDGMMPGPTTAAEDCSRTVAGSASNYASFHLGLGAVFKIAGPLSLWMEGRGHFSAGYRNVSYERAAQDRPDWQPPSDGKTIGWGGAALVGLSLGWHDY